MYSLMEVLQMGINQNNEDNFSFQDLKNTTQHRNVIKCSDVVS